MKELDKKAELMRLEFLGSFQSKCVPWVLLSEKAKNNWRLLANGGYFYELASLFDVTSKNRNGGYDNCGGKNGGRGKYERKKKIESAGIQP